MIYNYEIKELLWVDYNAKYFAFVRLFPYVFPFIWDYKKLYKEKLEKNYFTWICLDYDGNEFSWRLVFPFKYISEFQKFLLSWDAKDLPEGIEWKTINGEELWPIWYKKIWEDFLFKW